MISGDQTKDLWAILVVVILLPIVMLSMKMSGSGKKKGHKASGSRFVSQVAASFFATILLGFFGMFGLALIYASSSQVDYAAAGAGWWRETLRVFCQEEGLHFGQGQVSDLTCDHDVFQLEKIDENTLAYLPRPFIASMIIRDPRGIVLEEYEKMTRQCMTKGKMLKATNLLAQVQGDSTQQERRRLREIDLSMKLNDICHLNKEEGLNLVIKILKLEGCSGSLSYICVVNSLSAKAFKQVLKLLKYEDLWGNAAAGFAEAGRWYGLKGKQLEKFTSIGRVWTEDFKKLLEDSPMVQARESGSWKKHFSTANINTFKKEFGHSLVELGYEASVDSW